MPFVAPLFVTSGALYKAKVQIEPDEGAGTAGGLHLFTATFDLFQDLDDYFGTEVNDPVYDYLPFNDLVEYEITLIKNELVVTGGVDYIDLIELDSVAIPNGQHQIFRVWETGTGKLYPSPTLFTPDTGGFSGLTTEIYTGAGGSRNVTGFIELGIRAV